jgi:hypothetical protein
MQADPANLFAVKEIFRRVSNATGLTINWNKSDACWISHPHPPITQQLDWLWKLPIDPGELLGFSFTSGLHPAPTTEALFTKLKSRLKRWESFHLTLKGKVVVANHLILSGLWYFLTLNASNPKLLHKLQRLINAYIWSSGSTRGKYRVLADIITLLTSQGGLGLIHVSVQAKILGIRIFL